MNSDRCYAVSNGRDGTGGTGGSSYTPPQKTVSVGDVDINYTIDSKGVVTLKPTAAQLDKLLDTIGEDGILRIDVSGIIEGMKSAIIEIDLTKLIASDTDMNSKDIAPLKDMVFGFVSNGLQQKNN